MILVKSGGGYRVRAVKIGTGDKASVTGGETHPAAQA